MSETAYIVGGYRTAVGKAPKGGLRFVRPDSAAVTVIKKLRGDFPQLEPDQINDVIVGCATPEAEQGLNVGRLISLMGLDSEKVPGMTVNRYCASGLETIAIATAKIQSGMSDCIIAGGVEFMSAIPMGGWRIVPNAKWAHSHPTYYWGMGLTAEEVAKRKKISRTMQDEFAYTSHQRAANAINKGYFKNQIVPIENNYTYVDKKNKLQTAKSTFDTDEGVRTDTGIETMAKLRPVFMQDGTVTAANSSQTSDGASFVMVMSEKMVKKLNVKPIARLVSYAAVGLEPAVMGLGPLFAIPEALKKAGKKLDDIDIIELNEAFASQSVAIKNELNINPDKLNVNGGAIALGHPLGCTGSKLTVQMMNELKRRKQKYGMVTMCVGTGQGAAGIFEMQ